MAPDKDTLYIIKVMAAHELQFYQVQRFIEALRSAAVVVSQPGWPDWWKWELDCSNPHLSKRMRDRSFGETDLRDMLERATSFRADFMPGRWVVETTHLARKWEVIVEPDGAARVLIVVTAFAVG